MEKKSTKIAYFVALGIFIVLLVVLGISYKDAPILIEGATTPFAGTFWSLLPPIVAIVLALISKEVYSSLFLGCLVGALLYTQFAPWDTIVTLVGADYGIISVLADSGINSIADLAGKRVVVGTPDRSVFWNAQTPQVFRAGIYRRAHASALSDGFVGTDDSSLIERLGGKVLIVEGKRDNIKLTVPEDYVLLASAVRTMLLNSEHR